MTAQEASDAFVASVYDLLRPEVRYVLGLDDLRDAVEIVGFPRLPVSDAEAMSAGDVLFERLGPENADSRVWAEHARAALEAAKAVNP